MYPTDCQKAAQNGIYEGTRQTVNADCYKNKLCYSDCILFRIVLDVYLDALHFGTYIYFYIHHCFPPLWGQLYNVMQKEQFKNIESLYRKFVVQRYERQSCLPRNFPIGSGGKLQMPK